MFNKTNYYPICDIYTGNPMRGRSKYILKFICTEQVQTLLSFPEQQNITNGYKGYNHYYQSKDYLKYIGGWYRSFDQVT